MEGLTIFALVLALTTTTLANPCYVHGYCGGEGGDEMEPSKSWSDTVYDMTPCFIRNCPKGGDEMEPSKSWSDSVYDMTPCFIRNCPKGGDEMEDGKSNDDDTPEAI
uniref:Cnidarian restricted protein n=1 Tax=Clytia hemisphaerica TaxID=252671 RepID=A0A7M5V478_9CNID